MLTSVELTLTLQWTGILLLLSLHIVKTRSQLTLRGIIFEHCTVSSFQKWRQDNVLLPLITVWELVSDVEEYNKKKWWAFLYCSYTVQGWLKESYFYLKKNQQNRSKYLVEKSHPKAFSEMLLCVVANLLKEELNFGVSACDSEIHRLIFSQNLKLSELNVWLSKLMLTVCLQTSVYLRQNVTFTFL